MFAFLKRVLGTSEEHKAAEERYKKQLEELEAREKELDALGEQLHGVSELQKEKNEELSKTSVDLTATLSRSLTPPDMKAIKKDEQDETERSSGEPIPTAG